MEQQFPKTVHDALRDKIRELSERNIIAISYTPNADADESKYILNFLTNFLDERAGEGRPTDCNFQPMTLGRWMNGNERRFNKYPILLEAIETHIRAYHDDDDESFGKKLSELRRTATAEAEEDAEAMARIQAEARAKAEEELREKAKVQAQIEAEAKAKAEAEIREAADAKARIEAEAKQRAEGIVRARAEEEERRRLIGETESADADMITAETGKAKGKNVAPASRLSQSLEGFLFTANRILLFPPFSPGALSIHFSFAAFYAFIAIAVTWGIGGISDIGAVPILPTITEAGADRDFATADIIAQRFFVLAVVVLIVIVVVVGLIAAYVSGSKEQKTLKLSWVNDPDYAIALGTGAICGGLLWGSGMDTHFSVLFAVFMSAVFLMAGRLSRRALLALSFPVAFILSISLIVLIGNTKGSVLAAGGLLPAMAFLSMLIGAAASSRRATRITALVTFLCCGACALLNIFFFEGWFRIDPWDPGTVVIFLLLPMANGIWDFISASLTRVLTRMALKVTAEFDRRKALMIYVAYVLADIGLAFVTIILLYLTIDWALVQYNLVAFPDSNLVSLDAYFAGFQGGQIERGMLVIIMLATVLVPTLLHVHMVIRSMIQANRNWASLSLVSYATGMGAAVFFLFLAAQGILRIIAPVAPV